MSRILLSDLRTPEPPPPAATPYAPACGARRAILRCTPEILLWMGSGMFEVVANPLPADSCIVGAFYDGERHTFAVIVESESFAPVKEGDALPDLNAPTIKRIPVYDAS